MQRSNCVCAKLQQNADYYFMWFCELTGDTDAERVLSMTENLVL